MSELETLALVSCRAQRFNVGLKQRFLVWCLMKRTRTVSRPFAYLKLVGVIAQLVLDITDCTTVLHEAAVIDKAVMQRNWLNTYPAIDSLFPLHSAITNRPCSRPSLMMEIDQPSSSEMMTYLHYYRKLLRRDYFCTRTKR